MNFKDWKISVNTDDCYGVDDIKIIESIKTLVFDVGFMPTAGMLFGYESKADIVLDSISFYAEEMEICFWFREQ